MGGPGAEPVDHGDHVDVVTTWQDARFVAHEVHTLRDGRGSLGGTAYCGAHVTQTPGYLGKSVCLVCDAAVRS